MDGTISTGRRFAIASALCCVNLLLLLLVSQQSQGCPFCLSAPQTLAEQISRADVVLIAELVRFRVYDRGTRPESTLRIREYLRGEQIVSARRELAVGQAVVIEAEAAGQPGDMFLMFGQFPEGTIEISDFATAVGNSASDPSRSTSPLSTAVMKSSTPPESIRRIEKTSLVISEFISWNETTAISESAIRYLRTIPGKGIGQPQRLEYFLRFLEHADPLIAIDAWAEFGCSSYEDVVAVRNLMSREELRAWIADPLMSPERLCLYGMMLGLCGTAEDSQFLKDQMQDHDLSRMSLRYGSEGLMAGYLLLTGEPGLGILEETFILPTDVPDTASHAVVQALQFMWSYERAVIPEARICEAMRLLLKSEAMREIAITNLSRWEDWSTLPELMAMFDDECAGDRSARRAILQFAQACVKAGKAKKSASEHAAEAALFIARIQASSPELLASPLHDFTAPQ